MHQVMGVVMVMGVAAGCATTAAPRAKRWPTHRQIGDARFAELERQTAELARDNASLTARVTQLEAQLKAAPAVETPAPSATP